MNKKISKLAWRDISGMYYLDRLPQNYISNRSIDWVKAAQIIKSSLLEGEENSKPPDKRVDCGLTNNFGLWTAGWCFNFGIDDLIEMQKITVNLNNSNRLVRDILHNLIQWDLDLTRIENLFYSNYTLRHEDKISPQKLASATSDIIYFVVNHFGTLDEGEWRFKAETLIAWYLESLGIKRHRALRVTTGLLSGKFDSWVELEKEQIKETAVELSRKATTIFTDK